MINILKQKGMVISILVITFIAWYFAFAISSNPDNNNNENLFFIENITIGTFGVMIFLVLVFKKNPESSLEILAFVPFVFSRSLDAFTFPKALYFFIGIIILGLFVNFFRFRPKIAKGRMLWGIVALCGALVVGGIAMKSDYIGYQITFMLVIGGAFCLLYLFFVSSVKKYSFERLAFLMTCLGLLLALQSFTFYLGYEDFENIFEIKKLDVGWGISNNIALMLLLTIPFTYYLCLSKKIAHIFIYIFLTVLQILTVLISFSRGCIAILAVELVVLFFTSFFKHDYKWRYFWGTIIFLICLGTLAFFKFKATYPEMISDIINNLLNLDFETLNGRMEIYRGVFVDIKDYWLFGRGVLAPFYEEGNDLHHYSWIHSTILQTLSTMGVVGVTALLYHFFEKYYLLIRQINLPKFLILVAFASSGLYGMIDVSYYFINYMIVIMIIFILTDHLLYRKIKNVEHISMDLSAI